MAPGISQLIWQTSSANLTDGSVYLRIEVSAKRFCNFWRSTRASWISISVPTDFDMGKSPKTLSLLTTRGFGGTNLPKAKVKWFSRCKGLSCLFPTSYNLLVLAIVFVVVGGWQRLSAGRCGRCGRKEGRSSRFFSSQARYFEIEALCKIHCKTTRIAYPWPPQFTMDFLESKLIHPLVCQWLTSISLYPSATTVHASVLIDSLLQFIQPNVNRPDWRLNWMRVPFLLVNLRIATYFANSIKQQTTP